MIVEMIIIIRRRRRPPHFSQQSQEALRGWCKVLFEGEQKRLLRFALLCFRSSVLLFFFFCRRRALLPAAIINAAAESGQPTTTAEQPLPPARPGGLGAGRELRGRAPPAAAAAAVGTDVTLLWSQCVDMLQLV